MPGVNKCIIVGNIGKDPDVRYNQNNEPVVNCSVATSETWKDKQSGQKQEKTEWHRVVFFGGLAKIAAQYLHKGSKVYVEGKLQTKKWQNKEGVDQYTTEIIIDGFNGTLQMLDGAQQQGGGNNQPQQQQNQQQQQFQSRPQQQPQQGYANQNQQSQMQGQNNYQQQQGGQQQNQQKPTQQQAQQAMDDGFDDDIPF